MGRYNENGNTNSNSDISKSAISSNLTVNSIDNKVMSPKRDKRCIKTKNEDFFMILDTGNKRKDNNLIIYHQHIRSLNKKQDEINIMLQECQRRPHLICLSEHHMKKGNVGCRIPWL